MTPKAQGILRFFIGLVLIATSIGKLADVRGFARILSTYRALPEGSLLPLALAIPFAELALAIWLISGRRLAGAALASGAMHFAYAGWSAVALLRGLRLDNCGCFGVFLARPMGWETVAEDQLMVGLSLWILALRGKIPPAKSLNLEMAALYWHFVDVVWIVIFPVVYLIK